MTLLLSNSILVVQLLCAAEDLQAKFFAAINRDDVASVQALLKQNPELARTKNARGSSPLLVAATIMDSEAYFYPPTKNRVLQEIIRLAPPENLSEACIVGDLERARSFLEKNPNAIREVDTPWTLLHDAAYSGNLELVKLLLSRGARIDAEANTKYRNTPLQVAMLTKQEAVARYLVEAGADVNHKQWEGGTVLMDAARQGNIELARFFLSHGAEVNARSLRGDTAIDEAKQNGPPELAAMLEKVAETLAKRDSNSARPSSMSATPRVGEWPAGELWFKCRGCHGMDGKGNTVAGVQQKIPDLSSPAWQSKTSDEQIRKLIVEGTAQHKSYGRMFTPEEIDRLIPFIRKMNGT